MLSTNSWPSSEKLLRNIPPTNMKLEYEDHLVGRNH